MFFLMIRVVEKFWGHSGGGEELFFCGMDILVFWICTNESKEVESKEIESKEVLKINCQLLAKHTYRNGKLRLQKY